MKKTIKNIEPFRVSIISAVICGIYGLGRAQHVVQLILPSRIPTGAPLSTSEATGSIFNILISWTIGGFLVAIVTVWLYNLIVKIFGGGIQIDVE